MDKAAFDRFWGALALALLAGISIGVSALEYFVVGSLFDYIAVISVWSGVLAAIAMLVVHIYKRIAG